MSRRIAYLALATAALIVTPAAADRECFENSCRLPELSEPPARAEALPETPDTPAPPAQAAQASPMPSAADVVPPPAVVAPPAAAARVPAPTSAQPQMVVDPAPRPPLRPMPRTVDDARGNRFPAKPAPSPAEEPRAPARVTSQGPSGGAQTYAREPGYVSNPSPGAAQAQGQVYGRAAIIAVPRAHRAEDGAVPADADLQPDPSWKLCQIDRRDSPRIYHCGPYSYRPYGAHGYRPYGSYRADRSAPVFYLAPDAKIISIDSDD